VKEFLSQYTAMRFALDRQDRRRRGQHGLVGSLLLAFWQILKIALLLPLALIQLLSRIQRDFRTGKSDPDNRGTFFSGRRPHGAGATPPPRRDTIRPGDHVALTLDTGAQLVGTIQGARGIGRVGFAKLMFDGRARYIPLHRITRAEVLD